MNVNHMVYLFHRTIKNILRNFIPHEKSHVMIDYPTWINSSIRRLIQDKNISALKEVKTTIITLKFFNPFRIY